MSTYTLKNGGDQIAISITLASIATLFLVQPVSGQTLREQLEDVRNIDVQLRGLNQSCRAVFQLALGLQAIDGLNIVESGLDGDSSTVDVTAIHKYPDNIIGGNTIRLTHTVRYQSFISNEMIRGFTQGENGMYDELADCSTMINGQRYINELGHLFTFRRDFLDENTVSHTISLTRIPDIYRNVNVTD